MSRLSPSVVFLVSGLALLLTAGIVGYDVVQFRKKAVVVPGFVDEVYSYQYQNTDNMTSTGYGTIIGFRAKDGKTHFFIASVFSGRPRYARLDPVTVRYDPLHPEKARLDDRLENWFGTGGLGLMGVVFFAVGAAMWYGERPRA